MHGSCPSSPRKAASSQRCLDRTELQAPAGYDWFRLVHDDGEAPGCGVQPSPHLMPHIHAQYQGHQAQFDIASGDLLAGALPSSQTRLVQAWIELHQDELDAAWQLAVNGFRPGKIAPLK